MTKKKRNKLIRFLKHNKIDVRPMIFPVNEAIHMRKFFKSKDFPISREMSYAGLHLPSSTDLSKKKILFICKKINEFFNLKI